jgi:hypothetical protein
MRPFASVRATRPPMSPLRRRNEAMLAALERLLAP